MYSGHQYKEDVKVVILRRYEHLAKVNICAARLREAGIPCFISNANTSTILPFMEDGYVLHVNAEDTEAARAIVENLERQWREPQNDDYREADHDDIAYAKSVFETEQRMRRSDGRLLALLLIILALILVALGAYSSVQQSKKWNPASLPVLGMR